MTYFHQNSGFLKVSGKEAFSFLQAMVSRDIRKLHEAKQPAYSLLLNSKGKYKFDFFIWPHANNSYLIEIDNGQKEALKKMLNFYKLRADVQIEDYNDVISASALSPKDDDFTQDPRCAGLYRALKPKDTPLQNDFDYDSWRIKNGFAIYDDLKSDEDTPIEIGFDDLNAISYDKGCFLGQEGTNKAKHRLIIKQRLLPFTAAENAAFCENLTTKDDKKAGEVRLFKQGNGLAFIKLKYREEKLFMGDTEIKIHQPFWLPEERSETE